MRTFRGWDVLGKIYGFARRHLAVLVVIAVFAVGCAALSWVFLPKNNSPESGMIDASAYGFLGEGDNTVDVLFVGDSLAYANYSPLYMWHEYGISAYDASTPGQQPPYAKTLLKRAFTKQRPRLVVFETDLLYREFGLSDALLREIQDIVPLFEYHSRWKDLSIADFTSSPHYTWSDEFKGYKLDANVEPADVSSYSLEPTDEVIEPLPSNRIWVRAMVEYCKEQGAIPLFISSPSPANWSMARHNGIEALASELGIDHVDLNLIHKELGINWSTDSGDGGDHVNTAGAHKVSHYVGKYLMETYGLVDHRGDATYSSWEDAYGYYAQRVNAIL